MDIGLPHFLIIAGFLFALGLFCVLTRRNAIAIMMGIELILNAANINLVAFNHFQGGALTGQVFAAFVIVLAAAEAVVGLAIVLSVFQNMKSIDVGLATSLRD